MPLDGRRDECVRRALESLSPGSADLIGDGLGGEVALQLTAAHPGRFRHVVAITRRISRASSSIPWPGLAPRLDGGHLLEGWFMLRDRRLWSPWHLRTTASIVTQGEPDLDPQSLHAELVELLKCGEHFAALADEEAAADLPSMAGTAVGFMLRLDGGALSPAAGRAAPMRLPAAGAGSDALISTVPMVDWDTIRVVEGIGGVLKYLHSSGRRIVLATSASVSDESQIRGALARGGLDSYFSPIYCFQDTNLPKGEAFYRHILNDLNISASDALMVGDGFEKDVQIPNSLGIFAVWFNPRSEETRTGELHATVHSMEEVREFFESFG